MKEETDLEEEIAPKDHHCKNFKHCFLLAWSTRKGQILLSLEVVDAVDISSGVFLTLD
jgi:hypothetical protein